MAGEGPQTTRAGGAARTDGGGSEGAPSAGGKRSKGGSGGASGGGSFKENLQTIERTGGRAGTDTLKLWESYKEQALLWRALALLQIPSTALAVLAALVMFFFSDTIIEVPERPQPGYYSVKQLPDAQFIGTAIDVINHIATYTPSNARSQFRVAKKWLWEPALTEFEETMWIRELKTIEETMRSQLFIVNERFTKVERYPNNDYVVVQVPGIRYKLIGGQAVEDKPFKYILRMTTIPKSVFNEYGIVVTDIRLEEMPLGQKF